MMHKSRMAGSLTVVACICLGFATEALGVGLELRPPSQSAYSGQTVEIELYAVADPAENVGVVQVVLFWDAARLTLIGADNTGAGPWQSYGFPSGGLNSSFLDGDAYFTANVAPCTPLSATPAGLLVTTLRFTATPSSGSAQVSILPSLSGQPTRVYNNLTFFGCGGQQIAVNIGPAANVDVSGCLSALNCEDGDACTADACTGGVCTHLPNYPDQVECCDPNTGATMTISDGNDCTNDLCNILTGAVSHSFKNFGSICGSQVQNSCTNPDTCDSVGVCLPNNLADGNICNDNDTCSNSSTCQSGVCVGGDPQPDGTPCTDGLNCTTGSGMCASGKCVEPNPVCPTNQFCVEKPTCLSDSDCSGAPGSCNQTTHLCNGGFACRSCLASGPKACLTSNDCPTGKPCEGGFCRNCAADVGCVTRYCSPFSHMCTSIQHDEDCQDGVFCNGDEQCDAFGTCQPASPPNPGCGAMGEVCDEGSDDCVECVDSSSCPMGDFCDTFKHECVDCLINAHCNDGNSCNGIETCNLSTGECIPGNPVGCSQPNICTIDVCNPSSGLCEPKPAEQVACSMQNPCPQNFVCGPQNVCVPILQCTDGNGCTINDFCAGGECVGQPLTSNGALNLKLAPTTSAAFAIGATIDIRFTVERPGSCTLCGGINSVEGGLNWDQIKVGLQSPAFVDPCTNHSGDPLNCPLGPPRQYDWFSSGLLATFDPDGLNDSLIDGDAHYIAFIGPGSPDAPVTPSTPLWVTTFKFTALSGTTSAGTQIKFIRCVGPEGTFSRAVRDAGLDDTKDLITATVRVNCTSNAQCNDNNPCTNDTCNLSTNFCEYGSVSNGTPCGNQTPTGECDLPDSCQAGVCSTNPKPNNTPCTDEGNQCTNDLCNGAGICAHPNKTTGTPCNDNLFCTINETCSLGVCGSGALRSCADAHTCTIDSCNESTDLCVHTPENSFCNDSQFCNGIESCNVNTGCVAGTPVDCSSDGVACTQNDFCNETLNVCDGVPNDALCPQGEVCISLLGCINATCPPPGVSSSGSRFIQVVPNVGNPDPIALFVESPDTWPCLGKYVGAPFDVDMDADGIMDGKVAKLVDDPGDAAVLTPAQWGGTVWITGEYITPTDEVEPNVFVDAVYQVSADCAGSFSPPVSTVMQLYGDADENGIVNFIDVTLAIKGFQGTYHLPPGPNNGDSTRASVDVKGNARGCDPDFSPAPPILVVNFVDVFELIRVFQGVSYETSVLTLPPAQMCDLPCP